ncbi:MAG: hypothetical protein GY810_18595 [Aureispira sp.]|nr:hypothetical protein [Aureispira sp.]
MNRSKLVKSLKFLSVSQLKQFKDYVGSPFFNKQEQLKLLLELLSSYYPDFDQEELQQNTIIKKLSLSSPQQCYTLSSRLLDLLNKFLTYTQQQEQASRHKIHTIQALRQQGEPKALQTAICQHQTLQNHYPYKDAKNHYEKHLFYNELDQIFLDNPRRAYDENLQLKSDHLDIYYLITKLKYYQLKSGRLKIRTISPLTILKKYYSSYHFA